VSVSNKRAQEQYLAAREALDRVSRSRKASKAQKDRVRRERDRLDLEFIGVNIADVDERTRQYERFVENMRSLVSAISTDALVGGVLKLTEVIEASKPLLGDEQE